jgi:hypothetical protein
MRKQNELVICRDTYKSQEEFENAIKEAVIVLLNNNYIMTVKYDEYGVVLISYNDCDVNRGADYPYWLSPEEWESVAFDYEAEYE